MITATIHQPEHMSYLGFFHKVSISDVFIILDNVDYEKNYFQNRNRIPTQSGVQYLTVPVSTKNGKKIREVEISRNEWHTMRRKILSTIFQTYKKAPFFDEYFDSLEEVFNDNDGFLMKLNIDLMYHFFAWLEIYPIIYRASELNATGGKSELLANICKEVGATKYISGCSGRNYLDTSFFGPIEVEYQNFIHPVYKQLNTQEFIPYMSVIDALFCVGAKETMRLINQSNGR